MSDLYSRYISSAAWGEKRADRLEIDGHACQTCGHDGSQWRLEVHHKTYERLGDEDVQKDLITLCCDCHAAITSVIRERRYADRPILVSFVRSSDTILTARIFAASAAEYVRDHLTKPGSDFQRKLTAWLDGSSKPKKSDGHIALVEDQGEIVGWARTEPWSDGQVLYDTLEAYVAKPYRLRGIAAFAACGIYSAVLHDNDGTVAVFHPHMLLVARRAGLWPTLFEKEGGQWRRV
jgi:hypothetical protein